MRILIIAVALFFATAANAQQTFPDAAFLQRAAAALQAQRNQALDQVAVTQARADGLQQELSAAQAEVKRLKEKYEPEPKKDVPKK